MTVLDLRDSTLERERDQTTQLRDLEPGMLLFFARPSPLQSWAELFGHEWRHVGITVRTDEGLMIASYGPRKCFRLDDPAEIMGAYNRVGVARIFNSDAEVERVEAFCRRLEHAERSDSPYTFSAILAGPVHLLARRRKHGWFRSFLLGVVRAYCWLQTLRYHDRSAFACSTFAWAALTEVLDRPLRIPLRDHPEDEAAYASPSNTTDELLARWLCGPTEMWHAISPHSRSELDLSGLGQPVDPNTKLALSEIEEVASSGIHDLLHVKSLQHAAGDNG